MCGITGFVDFEHPNAHELLSIGSRMANAIQNRGPDSSGVWVGELRYELIWIRVAIFLGPSHIGHSEA